MLTKTVQPAFGAVVAAFWAHIISQLFSWRTLTTQEPNRKLLQLYYLLTGIAALAPAIPYGFAFLGQRIDSVLGFTCFINLIVHLWVVRRLRNYDFASRKGGAAS